MCIRDRLPPQKNPPAFSTLKRVYRERCIHRVYSTPGNRLSDFSPLLDVPTDVYKRQQKTLVSSGMPEAATYSGAEDAWKQLCNRDDIDLVYIVTDVYKRQDLQKETWLLRT